MKTTKRLREKDVLIWPQMLIISLAGAVFSAVFCVILSPMIEAYTVAEFVIIGAITGAVISFVSVWSEIILIRGVLPRASFAAHLLLRVAIWTVLIVIPVALLRLPSMHIFVLFGLSLGLLFSLVTYLFRIVGAKTMFNILSGRYNHPINENMIFLFADLKGSTGISERLGTLRYHEFINDVWFDISSVVKREKGYISKYIGDEVIITWSMKTSISSVRSIRAALGIYQILVARSGWYQEKYGECPHMRMGLHGGQVTVGEIGDSRLEITYLGDAVNTAARLMTQSDALGCEILLSGPLVQSAASNDLPPLQFVGDISIRGRKAQLAVHTFDFATLSLATQGCPPGLDS